MINPIATSVHYTIEMIKAEASQLVYQGMLHRQQPIYTLCQFIPAREWPKVEWELEQYGYLLRDRIIDLLDKEVWVED